jgi:hypothetical protein
MAACDFVERYVGAIFGLIGIIHLPPLTASRAAAVTLERVDAAIFLHPYSESIRQHLAPAVATNAN